MIHLSSIQSHIYLHVMEQILHYYQIITQNEDEVIFDSLRGRYALLSGGRDSVDCIATRSGLGVSWD